MNPISVERLSVYLFPSPKRMLIRPFIPDEQRRQRIIARIMSMPEDAVYHMYQSLIHEFQNRHPDIEHSLLKHYDLVKYWSLTDTPLSEERKRLIGAYFTQEYALESTALFNPSIVLHPNQTDLPPGSLRFILSLRALGEGHISSIVFREGILTSDFRISIQEPTLFVTEPEKVYHAQYDKRLFHRKLIELNLDNSFTRAVLSELKEFFTYSELSREIELVRRKVIPSEDIHTTARGILLLAESNYEVRFSPKQQASEKVIFPSSPSQSNGIEDARFVLFQEEGGARRYYATYTAYDGRVVLPQLLETEDFVSFHFHTLNGPAIRNKGMALFPRKINGLYAMISRQDNENIYLMYSDNVDFWYEATILLRPTYTWEYVQIGNSGPPLELEEGWLVLNHGVGPMRKYGIGAFLLDKQDPSRVIGRLPYPLLEPMEDEREGYVPNVVYTCGALIHRGTLVLPYAISDYATTFALIQIKDILNSMV